MVDKVMPPEVHPATSPAATAPVPPPRRPGHRGADVRDTVAEMAAKAQEISLEAGSKMAAAMKDVIGAAAGLAGFAVESARDLVQFMVRRGQMTQEEADKLMREAEAANAKRKSPLPVPVRPVAGTKPAAPSRPALFTTGAPHAAAPSNPVGAVASRPAPPAAAKPAVSPVKKGVARGSAPKAAAPRKPAPKKPAPKKPAPRKPAPRKPAPKKSPGKR